MRKPSTGTVAVAVAGHLPTDPRAKLAAYAKHVSDVAAGSFAM